MRFSFQLSRKWRERLHDTWSSIAYYVTYPWFRLVGAASWLVDLVTRAWHTRHFRHLIQGFPALFAMAGVVICGVFVAMSRAQERRANLAKDYLLQVGEVLRRASSFDPEKELADRDEQLNIARTYIEKALSLEGGDRDDLKFQLALILEELSKHKDKLGPPQARSAEQQRIAAQKDASKEHCLAIMEKLAPNSSNGFAPAHIWRGRYWAQNFAPVPAVLAYQENHLSRAHELTKSDPDSPIGLMSAHLLASMYVSQKRFAEAVPLLEKIEGKDPEKRILLGGVYLALNRPADATKMFQSAERHFARKSQDKLDDRYSRFWWARSLMAQQKFNEAAEVLKKGLVMSVNDQLFKAELAEIYRQWELMLAKPETKGPLSERLKLIQKGIEEFPGHVQLLARLHVIATMQGPEGEEANKQILDMLQKHQNEPILWFIMGSYEYKQGRKERARDYWQRAFDMNRTFSWVGNNLALLLAFDEKNPDPERALEMIERVIAESPHQPNFHGTRGQILTKMKRYKEAVPDLKKGLSVQPNDIGLNEAMAEVYESEGDRTLAGVHRKKVLELKEQDEKQKLDPNEQSIPREIELPKPTEPASGPPKPPETPKPSGG